MWPNGRIVPASDRRRRESRRHALTQASGPVTTRFRVVIDVGVVVPDDLRILGRSRRWRREVLAHRNLLVFHSPLGRASPDLTEIATPARDPTTANADRCWVSQGLDPNLHFERRQRRLRDDDVLFDLGAAGGDRA